MQSIVDCIKVDISGVGTREATAPHPQESSLVPRPQPQEEEEGLVTFERFLGSCKLSILTFAKANQIAAPRFSCNLASGRTATIVQRQLAV